jgi:multiple sugar transport system substrate-binding protein
VRSGLDVEFHPWGSFRNPGRQGHPPDKYAVLSDSLDWATNVGYPGHSTAAVDDAYSTWVLNTMFAQAATGALSPEDAVKEADRRCRLIWDKWKERRLI